MRLCLLVLIIVSSLLVACNNSGQSGEVNTNPPILEEIPGLGTLTIGQSTFTSSNGGITSSSLSINSSLENYNYEIKFELPSNLINSGAYIKYIKPTTITAITTYEFDKCIVTKNSPSCGFILYPGNSANGNYIISIAYKNNDAIGSIYSQLPIPATFVVSGNMPTPIPTIEPTTIPTVEPTIDPTVTPTVEPTSSPTAEPTIEPTITPTMEPIIVLGNLTLNANESNIVVKESNIVTLTLTSSQNITSAIIVNINSDTNVINLDKSSCSLTTLHNICYVIVTGVNLGEAIITATANDYQAVTTKINVISSYMMWEWMSGATIINQYGRYGGKGILNTNNILGARSSSISWSDEFGNFWLFGGAGYASNGTNGELNDLWKYNINMNQWVWVSGALTTNEYGSYGTKGIASFDNMPGARSSSISWSDESGNFWFLGGHGYAYNRTGNLNDLWKYDIVLNQWIWVTGESAPYQYGKYGTKGTASSNNILGGRSSAVSWSDRSNNLWLFGGDGNASNGNGLLNDLWKYNIETNQWTWMSGAMSAAQMGNYGIKGVANSNNIPGARDASISWSDESGNLWLFGGWGYDRNGRLGRLNDLWKYDIEINQWTWVSGESTFASFGNYGIKSIASPNNMPGARSYSISWSDESDNLWLFGGSGGDGYLNDLWKYNIEINQWSWVSGESTINQRGRYGINGIENQSNIPGARNYSASWNDESGNLWLFGGGGYDINGQLGSLNDLWKYNLNQ